MVFMFRTTYVCEQTFSKMKNVKSEDRTRLTDEHLEAILLIQCSNTKPNIEDIMKNKEQFHKSHLSFSKFCLVVFVLSIS